MLGLPRISSKKAGVRTVTTTTSTTTTTASPSTSNPFSEDGRKNSIRVRIKQRKRLFSPTRNRFLSSPSSSSLLSSSSSATTTTEPTSSASSSSELSQATTATSTPVTPVHRVRSRNRNRLSQLRSRLGGNRDSAEEEEEEEKEEDVRHLPDNDDIQERVRTSSPLSSPSNLLPSASHTPTGAKRRPPTPQPSSPQHRFQLSESVQKLIRARTHKVGGDDGQDGVEEEEEEEDETVEDESGEVAVATPARSRTASRFRSGQVSSPPTTEEEELSDEEEGEESVSAPSPSRQRSRTRVRVGAGALQVDQVRERDQLQKLF